MRCPKCNHEHADGAKFCSNCATQLCQVCPSCNAINIPIEAKFCPVCGNKLNLIAKEEELVNECERLSEEEKLVVSRARKVQRFLSQPFSVAGQFTGLEGRYVPLEETIQGFKEILEGKHDQIPESMFLFAGGIDEVVERYEKSHE